MRKKIYPVSWLIQARLAEIAMLVEENISGVRVVKSFAAEQKELTTLARAADKLQWAYIKDANIRGTWAPTLENLPRVGLAVILLYGGFLVIHDHLGVGTLFTFQAYMLIFQPPFRQLGMVIMNGQRASASAKRIYEVLDQPQEVMSQPGAVDLVECRGDVTSSTSGFAYSDGTQVLNDFDLHIAPGETVALVGRTGSGKTTAGRLLNRSYDVSDGRLLVDGRDVREYTLESLRAQVGFVFDEPFLFSVSIRDNIAYGKPAATIEEVVAAAKAADADEFIVRLPDGYDTVIGERGYTLSGGQRQRMAIARTLLDQPAGARPRRRHECHRRPGRAADPRLARGSSWPTGQRLSSLTGWPRSASRTASLLVENGHVIASGRHQELLENDPRYAEVLARVIEEEEQEHEPMSMAFGGGPMWGGGAGGGGRPGAWGGAGNATQGGAPFAGIPPELEEAVSRVGRHRAGPRRAGRGLHPAPDRYPYPDAQADDHGPLAGRVAVADIPDGRERSASRPVPISPRSGSTTASSGKNRTWTCVIACGVIYLVTVLLTVFVERARIRNTGKLAAQVMNDLRVRVYAHIQRLSLDYFTDEKAGVIMTRMTSDIEVLQQLLQDGLAQFAIQGLTMVFVTAVLFSYNWKLALITIADRHAGAHRRFAVVPFRVRARLPPRARQARRRDRRHRRKPLGRAGHRLLQPPAQQRHPSSQRARCLPRRQLQDGPGDGQLLDGERFHRPDGPGLAAPDRRHDGAQLLAPGAGWRSRAER